MTNKCARNTFMKQVYIVIAIILSFITTANAESWEAVIPAVEKRAAFYLSEADRLGYVNTEPPRYCRRLNILREYDNENTKLHS